MTTQPWRTPPIYGGIQIDPVTGVPMVDGAHSSGLLGRASNAFGGPQGLLNFGATLMSASGPSDRPVSLGGALGNALLSNQQFQRQKQNDMLQAALLKAKLQEPKKRKSVSVIGPNGTPMLVDEDEAIEKSMQPYSPMQRAEAPASIQEYNLAKEQGYNGTFQDWVKERAQAAVGAPYQMVEMGGGKFLLNRSAGSIAQQTSAEDEARGAAAVAGATAGAQTTAKSTAEAAFDLPRVEQNTSSAIQVLKQLRGHNGLGAITGIYSLAPIIPGTDQAAADALAKQVEGKAFLEAFNTLKGGGVITEQEGTKATAAIGRLQRAQKKEDYQSAIDDLVSVLENGLTLARKKAKTGQPSMRNREDILKQYGITPRT